MVPQASHQPSAQEFKELRAIAHDVAASALSEGSAWGTFRGFRLHAYSWIGIDGERVCVVLARDTTEQLISRELTAVQG